MNIKVIGGFILAIALSFCAGFGVSTWGHRIETKTTNEMEGKITTIVQNSLDSGFEQINKDYKDGMQKSLDQYLADKKRTDDAERLLSNPSANWVWIKPSDQEPASTAKAGTVTKGPGTTSQVRARLSDETSLPLKREAKRADDCANDYNRLKSDYDTLWLSVWRYNQQVDQYNGQFKK